MSAESKYRLYASKLYDSEERYTYFGDNTPYMLTYTDNELDDTHTYIPTENEHNLTEDEKKWLKTVKEQINYQYMREHKEEFDEILNVLLDRWEEELKKEREKLEASETK